MGAPVAEAIGASAKKDIDTLLAKGITPTLAIVRAGERPDDLAYEKGARKRAEALGIRVVTRTLSQEETQASFEDTVRRISDDPQVHAVLPMRPFPAQINEDPVRPLIVPEKDVDAVTDTSLAALFAGRTHRFVPCTAEAVMRLLAHYDIPVSSRHVVIIGRSGVIGRPLAMLFLRQDATVTVCHSKTDDLRAIAKSADILVSACGRLRMITEEYVRPGQTVIDVGINWDEQAGKIAGDVDASSVAPVVSALTPVPGGIGAITSAVLCAHVVTAAMQMQT